MNIRGPEGGEWTVTIKDQKMEIKQGVHPSPAITVKMVDSDFVDLINGKLSGQKAFMTGKLQFNGSITVGLKLLSIGFM